MKISGVTLCAMMVVSVLLLEAPKMMVEAENCNPDELGPCISAVTSNTSPTKTCCQKLKQQKSCYCGYLKNPNYREYAKSSEAKRLANACQIAIPKC
ncbi:hypothetical protein L6164_006462 [Bauhinia variegata]|uniref:Uncharacterized protein n=1 Tax=Bauhinia variegata TaxID=167791 RepID=A0ACB9PUK0_BAUVA|nr:hypothetical protein L6164_006462 [Bauhinia variegata]